MRVVRMPFEQLPHGVYELTRWVDGRKPEQSRWWCTKHGWVHGPGCSLCGITHRPVEHVEQMPWNITA